MKTFFFGKISKISENFKVDRICLEKDYQFYLESGVVQMKKDGKTSPLTSKNIIVDKLLFFVTPAENPFTKTTQRKSKHVLQATQ